VHTRTEQLGEEMKRIERHILVLHKNKHPQIREFMLESTFKILLNLRIIDEGAIALMATFTARILYLSQFSNIRTEANMTKKGI